MRKMIIMLMLVLGTNLMSSQTAVCVDYTTGSVGFSTANPNYLTNAYNNCINDGGQDITCLLKTSYKGYVCVLRGYSNGSYIFGVGYGYKKRKLALQAAKIEMAKFKIKYSMLVLDFYGE